MHVEVPQAGLEVGDLLRRDGEGEWAERAAGAAAIAEIEQHTGIDADSRRSMDMGHGVVAAEVTEAELHGDLVFCGIQ